MTAVEDLELLQRWCPKLHYDSMALFYAVSAAALTDAPQNRVVRGSRTLASASGVPLLSLEWLKLSTTSRSADSARRSDKLLQGSDRFGDARRLQEHARYTDRCYGRVLRREGAIAHLQFYFCFYSTPLAAARENNSPTWRLVQIDFADDAHPRITVRNPIPWLYGGGEHPYAHNATLHPRRRPELFVSAFTNNLYLERGERRLRSVWDSADGAGRTAIPACELFSGWERWPGKWAAESNLNLSQPSRWPQWAHPRFGLRSALQWTGYGLLLVLPGWMLVVISRLSQRNPPGTPVVKARLEPGRVVLRMESGRRRNRALVTVHDGDRLLAGEFVDRLERIDERALPLEAGVTRCVVRVRVFSLFARHSSTRLLRLAGDRPDELEKALLERVVDERLRSPEVRKYLDRLNVSEDDVRGALNSRSRALWSRVASDLQRFRQTRFEHARADQARSDMRAAAVRAARWLIATAVAVAAWLVVAAIWGWYTAGYVLAAGYYVPIGLLIAVAASQWRSYRSARDRLRQSSHAPEEDAERPLADARSVFERALGEKAVAPTIRERLNAATVNRYDASLDFGDEGLPELSIPEYEIPTRAAKSLERLTRRMRGGSIGVAGPRGAGKSTLIEAFCKPLSSTDRRLTTVISAPVHYDARDFVLTLFGQLCAKALSGSHPTARPSRTAHIVPLHYVAASVSLAVGAALLVAAQGQQDDSWREASLLAAGAMSLALSPVAFLRIGGSRAIGVLVTGALVVIAGWIAIDLSVPAWAHVAAGVVALVSAALTARFVAAKFGPPGPPAAAGHEEQPAR